MSLAPGEQRTLTEIENHLRRSDPRLAAMFGLLAAGSVRPAAGSVRPVMQPSSTELPGPHGRPRLIILAVVGTALIIACIAMAMNSASHAVSARAGQGPGTSSTSSVRPAGRLPFRGGAVTLRAARLKQLITLRAARLEQVIQRLGEVVQLGEVGRGQVLHQRLTLVGEDHPDHAAVLVVLLTADDAGRFRAVHQADRAVALQQQVLGKVPDRRGLRTRVPLDRDEQLVLRGSQTRRRRLILTPAQEAPQRYAEQQVVLEVVTSRLNGKILLTSHSLHSLCPPRRQMHVQGRFRRPRGRSRCSGVRQRGHAVLARVGDRVRRSRLPALAKACLTWALTVDLLTERRPAISALASPRATRARTAWDPAALDAGYDYVDTASEGLVTT